MQHKIVKSSTFFDPHYPIWYDKRGKIENVKILSGDWNPGPRRLDRHWNGFLLTSRGEKYQRYQDSEMDFQSKGPGCAPHVEWVFIFWFKSDKIIRNNTPIFVSQILLSSAVHILKLNDTEKSSMALVQVCNAKSWSALRFLSRTNPFDRIGLGKSKNVKTLSGDSNPGPRHLDWTGIEMVSCWLSMGGVSTMQRIVNFTSKPKVLGSLPMPNGCSYFYSNLTTSSEIIYQFLSVKLYFLRDYIYKNWMIQRWVAWPWCKDATQNCEEFHIFWPALPHLIW